MKPFQIHLIGTGSAVPSAHRAATSQVLHYDGRYMMIDCAEGTQMQLKRNKISPMRIERLFISHLHGDHYFGLIGLLNTLHLLAKTQAVHIHGPADLYDILRLQLKAADTELRFPLLFYPLNGVGKRLIFEDEQLRCFSFPVMHRIPTWGFLFEEKRDASGSDSTHALDGRIIDATALRSYAFCTDTAYRPELADFFRNVQVLYHEATFMHHLAKTAEATYHSTSVQAAEMARLSGAKRLIMGHFSSRYTDLEPLINEAREVFPQAEAGMDGAVIDIR